MRMVSLRVGRALVMLGSLAVIATGCGDHGNASPSRPSAAQLAGTYDVTAADFGLGDELLGAVHAGENGTIHIDVFRGTLGRSSLSGVLDADGTVTLSGDDTNIGPAIPVTGSAEVEVVERKYRISAVLESAVFDSGQHALTMERPVDTSLVGASGTYRFDFPDSPNGCVCPSSAIVDLTFDRTGDGSSAVAMDVAGGVNVGIIAAGSALLTPGGDFKLRARYRSLVPGHGTLLFENDIGFAGTLENRDGDVVGQGTLELPHQFVPPFLPRGHWSARRVAP